MSESSFHDDLCKELDRQFKAKIRGIAHSLRRAADVVDRHSVGKVPVDLYDLEPDYARVAQDILQEVDSWIPNLMLGSLVRAAAEADRAVRAKHEPVVETEDQLEVAIDALEKQRDVLVDKLDALHQKDGS